MAPRPLCRYATRYDNSAAVVPRRGDPCQEDRGSWYIDLDAERMQTGNELADDVLKSMRVS
ncbi:hypothetical protein [Modicisalibacter luteus]|uniref:hypothetical protein n=1 Tax=Modicisalibacter luteus TaxID=453962 RepID=UPI0036275FDB